MKQIIRNEHGLVEGVSYQFDENGLIDWRKMIEPKYLVPNKQYFEKVGKPTPKTTEGLEDKELLILLGGIKRLAQLRGYRSVNYVVTSPSPDYVISACSIAFSGNYETESYPITFSAIGDASAQNTNSFGRLFLGPIAENRSFVRCVRNFLRINIIGQDEVSPTTPFEEELPKQVMGATELLEKLMVEKGVTFEKVKEKLISEKVEGADKFVSIQNIPKIKVFELIERLRKKT
jgi:hypothetical protein